MENSTGTFPNRLKYFRNKKNWTQAVLAEKLGVQLKTVKRWEAGESLPQLRMRASLCEILGTTNDELGLIDEHPVVQEMNDSEEKPSTDSQDSQQAVPENNIPFPSSPPLIKRFPVILAVLLALVVVLAALLAVRTIGPSVATNVAIGPGPRRSMLATSPLCFQNEGIYKIISAFNKKVLQVRSQGVHDSLEIFPDVEEEHQYWHFVTNSNAFGIINEASGLGLDVPNSSQDAGVFVQQYPYNGWNNQLWQCKITTEGFIEIVSKLSGLVLGVPKDSQYNATRIDQEQETGSKNQLWQVVQVVLQPCNTSSSPSTEQASDNVALHKPVSASTSFEGSGWGVAAATDGERSSTPASMGWSSLNDTEFDHSEWIEIHLGKCATVHQVRLFPRTDAGNVGDGFPIAFIIQLSSDATNWKTVITEDNYPKPKNSAQIFTFTSQSARYIRTTGIHLRPIPAEGNAYRMQFAAIEVY